MSLCVTVYSSLGIVMGADSRSTMALKKDEVDSQGNPTSTIVGSKFFDNADKIILMPNNYGLSWSGDAEINGVYIGNIFMDFIDAKIKASTTLDDTVTDFENHLKTLPCIPKGQAVFAGYQSQKKNGRRIRTVSTCDNTKTDIPTSEIGIFHSGENGILKRIFNNVTVELPNNEKEHLESLMPLLNFMTLQDCIEYVKILIGFAGKLLDYSGFASTVGGPTKLLVFAPGQKPVWI
ncbi:MAG: hypothetical protein ACOX7B_07835 [Christensenellales bacterium]|jgi:hypothetical protein